MMPKEFVPKPSRLMIFRCAVALAFLFCSFCFVGLGPALAEPEQEDEATFFDEEEEELIFFEDDEEEKGEPEKEKEETVKKDTRVAEPEPDTEPWMGEKWDSRINLGGYWENEIGVDIVQDDTVEDTLDFRSKIFGYGTYKFTNRMSVKLSVNTLYWALEGGDPRQSAEFNIYEGYLSYRSRYIDTEVGQMLVRWGVCDVLSPTNVINPIRYTSFIDPDTEDHRVPLPMIKWALYWKKLTVEALYIPIFQSAIFEPWGGERAFISEQGEEEGQTGSEQLSSPFLDPLMETFSVGKVDFREERLLTGEAAVKAGLRFGKTQAELLYFNTREDFPVILYEGGQNLLEPGGVGADGGEDVEHLELRFNRYDMYGATFKTHLAKIDWMIEYAYSPERYMTTWEEEKEETEEDADIIRYETFEEAREWQVVALEMDYLDPDGHFLIKFGAEQSHYLDAPGQLLFPSDDTIRLLGFFRFYFFDNKVIPELRMFKIIEHWEEEEDEGNSESWFVSPRVTYKSGDRYSVTTGLNLFTSSGYDYEQEDSEHIRPITFMSENNQYFVSIRLAF